MIKNNANIMEQLDEYFANKSEGEKWAVILLVSALIGYILYTYLYPYAYSRYKNSLNMNKSLKRKIAADKTYLRSITVNGNRNYYIIKANRDIINKKKTIESYHKRIALLNRSFQQLSAVLFNKQNWAKFLDSITDRAHQNDIKIKAIENKYINDKGSFGHVLEMSIKCEGRFQGILGFINDLEQNKLVTDLYGSHIYTDANSSKIVADLNVSVWGVNR